MIISMDSGYPVLNSITVMWIRIDRMRIRIQEKKITTFISNHLLKEEKNISNLYINLRDKLLFSFTLEKYNYLKKPKYLLVKLCFSHNFIPLDPNECGSGSTSLLLMYRYCMSKKSYLFL